MLLLDLPAWWSGLLDALPHPLWGSILAVVVLGLLLALLWPQPTLESRVDRLERRVKELSGRD